MKTTMSQGETAKSIDWIVKQPGEHGKKLRVVERVGLAIGGEEILAGVCEILTSRTSADNFSDATEQKRAQLIAAAPDLLEACKVVEDFIYQSGLHGYDPYKANHVIAKLQNAAYSATTQKEGAK